MTLRSSPYLTDVGWQCAGSLGNGLILSCYQSEWQDDAELELFCYSDGRERAAHCNKRKQLKAIRRNADVNQHTNLSQPLIPVCKLLSGCVFSLSCTFRLSGHLSL